MGVSLSPAISQSPGGQLYGWLPLSNAYGIYFGEKQSISIILRHFIYQNATLIWLPCGIYFGEKQPISIILRHFFYQNTDLIWLPISISS